MADEHSRTPGLMPGTHRQDICDNSFKPLLAIHLFKRSLKTFFFILADIALCALEALCSMGYISLLKYLNT